MTAHLRDMKRATATLRSSGEFASVWQKSAKGSDHYHHALGYLWLAAQIREDGAQQVQRGHVPPVLVQGGGEAAPT